ncbi:MAG: histidinol-phosphate transaminase [Clostridiales bacterium]|nr:histidinol-phosphate transaminase [Clostridiales bacterium]HCH67737.1 histidinol-phosphate transaminase [Clostridiales bacterium]
MSEFLSSRYKTLSPYTPGEQPHGMKYIKLNTNESPFPPSKKAVMAAAEAAEGLQLYSDPECALLTEKMAKTLGLNRDQVLMTNGSDEILNFAFMAFCDDRNGAAFADVTYGFYPVFAAINSVPYTEIPLKKDFTLCAEDYCGIHKTIFIANPNAPTGIALPTCEIEKILRSNPDNVVVVDEAYVDFGGESCIPLIKKYRNLLVTQTFSKSRSMAGARLGLGAGCPELIEDLRRMKYSTNPYNVNSMTMAAGIGTLSDPEYTEKNCRIIEENREYTAKKLREMGFEVCPSKTNFLFVRHGKIAGEKLYRELKARGILVRHFGLERIREYNRVTIGTKDQMERFFEATESILKEPV